MILSEKRIRRVIREEILKKRKLHEELEPDERWAKITKMLGVDEKPTKVQYNTAWNKFVNSHYSEFEGGPSVNELRAQADVDSALDKIPGIEPDMDGEEKMFLFLRKYKDRRGEASVIKLGQKANWDDEVTLKLDKKGRIIVNDGEFEKLVDGIVDSLDGSVSKQNIKDVYDTYKELKGKHIIHPVTKEPEDAVRWLHKKYKSAEGGDTIQGDVSDLRDDEDLQDYAEIIHKVFGKFTKVDTLDESRSRRKKSKSNMILREMIRRQIRQLNEALPVGKDRLATPASGETVQTTALPASESEKAKKTVKGFAVGEKVRAKYKKDGLWYPGTIAALSGSTASIAWDEPGWDNQSTYYDQIKKKGGKSGGSGGGGSKYSTFKTEMWKKGPMKRNHKGDIVQKLQQALQKKTEGLKDDKYFGPNTEKALVAHPANEAKSKTVTKELFDKIIAYKDTEDAVLTPRDDQVVDAEIGGTGVANRGKNIGGSTQYRTATGDFSIKRIDQKVSGGGGSALKINMQGTKEKEFEKFLVGLINADIKKWNDKPGRKGSEMKPTVDLGDVKAGVITVDGIEPEPAPITKADFLKATIRWKGDWGPFTNPFSRGKPVTQDWKGNIWDALRNSKIIVPRVLKKKKK